MNVRNTFRTALVLGTACIAATAFAQSGAAPSKSGARKGYKTAAQHEAAAARGSKFAYSVSLAAWSEASGAITGCMGMAADSLAAAVLAGEFAGR